MQLVHVQLKNRNLEILSKIMNSVARKCNCRITYCPENHTIQFHGDTAYQRYIAEETLSFFRTSVGYNL